MRFRFYVVSLAVAAIFVCGCLDEEVGVRCPDGSIYSSLDLCPKPSPVRVYENMTMDDCEKLDYFEDKNACLTSIAVETRDLSLCDKTNDTGWVRYCYTRLNMSHLLPPEETTTTTDRLLVTTTTTTTTTTTLVCGNGALDEGEECDMGRVCTDSDGVCMVMTEPPYLATCLIKDKCDWSQQTKAVGDYDLGGCIGCNGPYSQEPCKCIKIKTTNVTVNDGSGLGGGITEKIPVATHTECLNGQCRKTEGKGDNSCASIDDCRHYVCAGPNNCMLVRSPGNSECKSNEECE